MSSSSFHKLLLVYALLGVSSNAFVVTTKTTIRSPLNFNSNNWQAIRRPNSPSSALWRRTFIKLHAHAQAQLEATDTQELSAVLSSDKPRPLYEAARFLQNHNNHKISRQEWDHLFDAMEQQTAADTISMETNNDNDPNTNSIPTSLVRADLTNLYQTLHHRGDLPVFGAIQGTTYKYDRLKNNMTPQLLEDTTHMKMEQLTPSKSDTLLWAGVAAAVAEGMISLATGINLNAIVLATLALVVADRVALNGLVTEGILKFLNPDSQSHIIVHEAGHLLLAYLLGCPVEGVVLDAWGASRDARFRGGGVTAGTSFYDPDLSQAMQSNSITRSLVDRYSTIVMAGIASEALTLGRAEGGASDELALVQFLRNLSWDGNKIKTQARWSAVTALDLLQTYQPCLEALIETLEQGNTSLGACVYAIEHAAREHDLKLPEASGMTLSSTLDATTLELNPTTKDNGIKTQSSASSSPQDLQDMSEHLQDFKSRVEQQLRETEEKLKNLNQ